MRGKPSLIFTLAAISFMIVGTASNSQANGAGGSPILNQEPTPIPASPNLIKPEILPCDPTAVYALYFYSPNCPHCTATLEDFIQPMQFEFGTKLSIVLVNIDYAENYELLIRTEEYYGIKAEERAIPTLVVGDEVLIGGEEIRSTFRGIVEKGILAGGIPWPSIPNFDPNKIISEENAGVNAEVCTIDSSDTCESSAPIYAAYFYQTGCNSCSRVEADLAYLRNKYPQLIVEKFNVYDHTPLGMWLTERAGRSDFHTPAVFIGSQAWIGEGEITPQAIETALQCYQQEGSPRFWDAFDADKASQSIAERFRSMSWLTVVAAGLVDGLNPCAFATLIFFVSYLTLSGHKGREIIFVGLAFTAGVFIAYVTIGLGFYKVLDILGETLQALTRVVYGLTAALCIGFAVFNIIDYFKVRSGNLEDMSLKLPKGLRSRINAVIREGRRNEAYVIGAFVTGLLIALLELACTGQVYLPTIIFVSSMPQLRLQAIFYLILYNLLFILPLVVVFILAYFGTTSKDLTNFLKKHAGAVKLGMSMLFVILGSWLIISIFA